MFNRFKKSLRNMAGYVFNRENTKILTGGFVLTITGVGLDLLIPYVLGETVAMLASGAATGVVLGIEMGPYTMVATGIGAYQLRSAVASFRDDAFAPIGPRAFKKAICDYNDHAVHRSMEDKSKPGEDMTRIQKGINAIYSFSTQLCTKFIPSLSSTASTAGLLFFRYGWPYGAMLGGAAAGCIAYNVSTAKVIIDLRSVVLETQNESFKQHLQMIEHNIPIQAFTKEEDEKRHSRDLNIAASNAELKSNRLTIRVARRQEFFLNSVLLATCFLALKDFQEGKVSAGDFAGIQGFMMQCLQGISALAQASAVTVAGVRDSQLYFDYLETSSPIVDNARDIKLEIKQARVEFKNVSFSYRSKPDIQVLKNISCIAEPGKKTGFVGSTGSGKSTAGRLLSRFIDSTSGQILIDGKNIQNVSLESLRSQIGTIEQNPVLRSGSLLDNILYGVIAPKGSPRRQAVDNVLEAARQDLEDLAKKQKQEAEDKAKTPTKEGKQRELPAESKEVIKKRIDSFPEGSPEHALIAEVLAAVDHAKLTDFVKENGLLTPIHERGGNLSGGQIQRVAIARVLMRGENLKFLLLDEATSALDAVNELQIQANIDEICTKLGVTSIWITHHLINLVNANHIYVLQNGQVVEEGTHTQLVARPDGVYYKMWQSQNLAPAIERLSHKPDPGDGKLTQADSRMVNFAAQGNHTPRLFGPSSMPITVTVSNKDEDALVIRVDVPKEGEVLLDTDSGVTWYNYDSPRQRQ